MKKTIVLSFLLTCSTILLIGQVSSKTIDSKFTLGAYGGLNIPKLTGGSGNPLSEGWSSRAGGAFGVTFTWNASTNFAWIANILYSSEGGQRNGMQAFDGTSFNPQAPAGTYFYADFKNEAILNYLEVPVMAKYSISLGKSFRLHLNFGPYAGFLLNAKQKTSGSSIVYSDPAATQPISIDPQSNQVFQVPFNATTDIKDQIHNLNFGFLGGLGMSHNLGCGEITLNTSGAYGLINIQKYSQDGKNHTGNLLVSLGYSIPL